MGFFKNLLKPNIVRLAEKKDINGLISALHNSDWHVRSDAQNALVEIGDPAVDPLLSALDSPDSQINALIVSILGSMREPRAVEPLITLLGTDNHYLLTVVIGALGKIGDTRAVDPLIDLLKTSNRPIQLEVISALEKIGDARAAAPLTCIVKNEYPYSCHPDVRRNAAIALGKLSGPVAVFTLSSVLHDYDSEVRLGAARGLKETKDPHAFDQIITDLKSPDYDTRMRAVKEFQDIGDTGFNALFPLLNDSDGWISGDVDKWIQWNNRADLSRDETGYAYITAVLLYNICTRDSEKNKVLQLMKSLLDSGSAPGDEQVSRLKKTVLESDNQAFLTFFFCTLDAFSVRLPTFPVIWSPLLEIAQQNHSALIFKFIERVVSEGSTLVKGYPPDPLWMRGITKPHIAGRKEFGWGDDLWMGIVSSGAAFLRDNIQVLPENIRETHRTNLFNTCNHMLKEWEKMKENKNETRIFKINGQIAYWRLLSGYFEPTKF